jgi:hypothetical protein
MKKPSSSGLQFALYFCKFFCFSMQSLISRFFADIPAPRSQRDQKHSFMAIIGTTLLAALAGIDSFLGIQEFVESHFDELSKMFNLPGGVPNHDTYRCVVDDFS